MIFKSPHASVSIPEISVTEYVFRQAAELGYKPALIDGPTGRTYTYGELPAYINRLAAGFARHRLRKGDVLAIFSPNLPEYALAFHAAAILGVATTTVPPVFTDDEIVRQLRDSGARYLLTIPALMGRVREIMQATGIEKVFVIGEAAGAISLASLFTAENHAGNIDGRQPVTPDPLRKIDPQVDVTLLPYSSGTTGFPKGVMLTHWNLVSMLRQMEGANALSQDDRMVCVVPMYHLYGLHIVVNLGLSQGATIITLPRYELDQFLTTLDQYEVTVAPLVPPLVLALARAPQVENYDLSKLRLIHCGAATLADNIARACEERLRCQVRYGYGLTEVSPLSHASLADPQKHKPGSVGYCLPNTECRIVDYTTGAELGPNAEGEIWIRGPQVMKGYLGNEQATAEMIAPDGWLRTGDIGYCDDEGRLFVVDRLKELIKTNGRQVAPAELEALLLSHPSIVDAAVVAAPDEKAGEVPKAFVVLKNQTSGEEPGEEVMEFVAARVAPYKRIRSVEFVREIPRSPAGKILRRLLKERERQTNPDSH